MQFLDKIHTVFTATLIRGVILIADIDKNLSKIKEKIHTDHSEAVRGYELLLGKWPSASYDSVGTFSRSYETSYSAFELLLGTWPSACYQRVDVPCMLGSGIINHPLCDEPGLKTKKVNHYSSEYNSPATHVRQGSWGNVCVTRWMREYSSR